MLQSLPSTFKEIGFTNEDIITELINNQNLVIKSIYKTHYTSIKKLVYSFKNAALDPDEIFHEGLTRMIVNIRQGRFRGECSLYTYLNSICRNICLKLLARPKLLITEENLLQEDPENDNYYESLAFISKLKKQMSESCRVIIDIRFKQSEEILVTNSTDNKLHGFDEIAQRLDITVDNARQRFKRCLEQLRKMVFTHPEYQTLFD